jgi:hypothetical protein
MQLNENNKVDVAKKEVCSNVIHRTLKDFENKTWRKISDPVTKDEIREPVSNIGNSTKN